MKKLGLGVLLVSIGVAFCACGDSRETALRNEVKKDYNAELLSFEQAQKEVDLKVNECLESADFHYRFIKNSSGDIEIITAFMSKNSSSFLPKKVTFEGRPLTIDEFKAKKPECFN